jgi:hypothetical protein
MTVAAATTVITTSAMALTSGAAHAATSTGRLHGVNRSGTEFMCVRNRGIFDGPHDPASVDAIARWHTNVVRIPLNEDCWLGLNGVDPSYSGANYRSAITGFVHLLEAHQQQVILDLHWTDGSYRGAPSGCGDAATCQKPMPDVRAVDLWKSVASAFGDDASVRFDLFNEPFPNTVLSNYRQSWRCWRDGATACDGLGFEAVGMRALVDAVRSTGARNTLLLGGLSYANDISQWLTYAPSDPDNDLVASWHSYSTNGCDNTQCWDEQVAPVSAKVPVLAGEIGEYDCGHGYLDTVMNWLDEHRIGYLAWTWNTWDCSHGPALITHYDGTPTAFGAGFREHLRALAQ